MHEQSTPLRQTTSCAPREPSRRVCPAVRTLDRLAPLVSCRARLVSTATRYVPSSLNSPALLLLFGYFQMTLLTNQ